MQLFENEVVMNKNEEAVVGMIGENLKLAEAQEVKAKRALDSANDVYEEVLKRYELARAGHITADLGELRKEKMQAYDDLYEARREYDIAKADVKRYQTGLYKFLMYRV